MRTLKTIAGCVCAALLLCACESTEEATTQSASLGILNDTCPVMGEAVDPNCDTVSYDGATIGFCCKGCIGKWNDMSDTDKAAFVSKQ
ncbi:MAG: hypothetical protein ACYTF9_07890 [Planctomycetota bacterium]|jgi:hypothetical protein